MSVDLAKILGGRMASAEGGSVPSGVGMERDVRGSEGASWSPKWGPGPRPETDFGVF